MKEGASKKACYIKPAMERWLGESPKEEPFRAVAGNHLQIQNTTQKGRVSTHQHPYVSSVATSTVNIDRSK